MKPGGWGNHAKHFLLIRYTDGKAGFPIAVEGRKTEPRGHFRQFLWPAHDRPVTLDYLLIGT